MKRLLASALAGALLMASAPSALAADSIDYSVTSASLAARGVAVQVAFEVVCQPIGAIEDFRVEFGTVGLTERVNGFRLASGRSDYYGGDFLLCDGQTPNAIEQTITTENYPFKQGVALLHLHIYLTAVDWTVSQYRSEDLEIRITR